jgi:hypothetical protein
MIWFVYLVSIVCVPLMLLGAGVWIWDYFYNGKHPKQTPASG